MISRISGRKGPLALVNSILIVASEGGVRRRLVITGRGTRRTGQLGSTFVTGVDRRVHAPLGTVVKFSDVLSAIRASGRHGRCLHVVRCGGRLLLRLIGSVVSLSGVRTKTLRLIASGICLSSVVERLRETFYPGTGTTRLSLGFSSRRTRYCVGMSHGELVRILGGLVSGTVGFATRKDMRFNFSQLRGNVLHFCIASAKRNVPGRCRGGVFKHFIGLGDFIRNVNLKLSVDRAVIGYVKNRVKIRSGRNGKTAF